MISTSPNRLTILGDDSCTEGLYVLKIAVEKTLALVLRRSKVRKTITMTPGLYSYVGSAFGQGFPLARRLVRHASRSGDKPAHAIRAMMQTYFNLTRLGVGDLLLKNGKPPHIYNVDPLLDQMSVKLVAAYAIRIPDPGTTELHRKVEGQLGRLLMDDPATVIFEPGLGAQDYKIREPGRARQTHLMRVEAGEDWWDVLPATLDDFVERLVASAAQESGA